LLRLALFLCFLTMLYRRFDSKSTLTHVILMSYNNTSGNERHEITCSQILKFLSGEFGEVRVHLVWNSKPVPPPCGHIKHTAFLTHSFEVNTLNNRWYVLGQLTRQLNSKEIRFLMLDDDLYISPALSHALTSATSGLVPAIAGPYTRRFKISDNGTLTYIMEDNFSESSRVEYHHILPRVLMLNIAAAKLLKKYFVAGTDLARIIDRTTTEDLLASLAMNFEGGRLIRTVPCAHSIQDVFESCRAVRVRGLATRKDWVGARDAALKELHNALGSFKVSTYRNTYRYDGNECIPSFKFFKDRRNICRNDI